MRSTSPAVFLRARPGAFRFGRDNRKRPSRPPRSPPRFASVTEPRSERRPAAGFGLHFDPVGIESRLPSPAGALSCGSGVAVTISSASLSLGAAGCPETQEQRDPASAGRRSRNPPGATARDDRAQSPPGMRRVVGRATLRSKGRVPFPSCGFCLETPTGLRFCGPAVCREARTGGSAGLPGAVPPSPRCVAGALSFIARAASSTISRRGAWKPSRKGLDSGRAAGVAVPAGRPHGTTRRSPTPARCGGPRDLRSRVAPTTVS